MENLEVPWKKEQLVDTMGRPLSQSLFLELGYNTDYAIFTLNDEDKIYQDRVYPSLKKWYLKVGDPTELTFARKCLLNWRHWKKLCENKLIRPYIEEWREELEVQIRAEGILSIVDQSMENFQAAKWLADRGWDKRGAGRPSKAEKQREKDIQDRIDQELKADVLRMADYK